MPRVDASPNTTAINGKRVTLRERIPLRDGHRIPALLQACADGDLNTQVAVARLVIESWEFPGDPSDAESYQELDTFSEVIPLMTWVAERVQARATVPKASVNGSSSR